MRRYKIDHDHWHIQNYAIYSCERRASKLARWLLGEYTPWSRVYGSYAPTLTAATKQLEEFRAMVATHEEQVVCDDRH